VVTFSLQKLLAIAACLPKFHTTPPRLLYFLNATGGNLHPPTAPLTILYNYRLFSVGPVSTVTRSARLTPVTPHRRLSFPLYTSDLQSPPRHYCLWLLGPSSYAKATVSRYCRQARGLFDVWSCTGVLAVHPTVSVWQPILQCRLDPWTIRDTA